MSVRRVTPHLSSVSPHRELVSDSTILLPQSEEENATKAGLAVSMDISDDLDGNAISVNYGGDDSPMAQSRASPAGDMSNNSDDIPDMELIEEMKELFGPVYAWAMSFDFNRFCDPREYKPDEGFTNLLRKMRTLINDMKENVDDVGILRDKMRLLKPKLFESASKRLVAAPSGLGNPAEPSKVVATNGKSAKDPSPQRQGSLGFATDRLPNQIKRSEEMPEKNELIMAVKAKKLDKITELLKMGENPNVRAVDGSGWTPLMIAVDALDIPIVRVLLESEADLNATNAKCETALHIAVSKDAHELVELLLQNGADRMIGNIRNETAREFANSATLRKLFDTIPVPTHKRSGVDSYVCVTHHSAPEDGNSSGVDLFALSPKKTPTYARPFGQRTGSSSKGSLVGSDKVGDGKDPLSADDSSSGLKSRNKTLGTSRVGKGGGASKQAPLGDFEKLPSTINENAAAVTTGSLQKSPYEFPVTQVTNQPDVKKSAVKKGGSKGKTEEKESSSSGNVKKKLTRLYSDGEDSDLDLASDAKKRDESSSRKKISNVKAQDSGKDTSSGKKGQKAGDKKPSSTSYKRSRSPGVADSSDLESVNNAATKKKAGQSSSKKAPTQPKSTSKSSPQRKSEKGTDRSKGQAAKGKTADDAESDLDDSGRKPALTAKTAKKAIDEKSEEEAESVRPSSTSRATRVVKKGRSSKNSLVTEPETASEVSEDTNPKKRGGGGSRIAARKSPSTSTSRVDQSKEDDKAKNVRSKKSGRLSNKKNDDDEVDDEDEEVRPTEKAGKVIRGKGTKIAAGSKKGPSSDVDEDVSENTDGMAGKEKVGKRAPGKVVESGKTEVGKTISDGKAAKTRTLSKKKDISDSENEEEAPKSDIQSADVSKRSASSSVTKGKTAENKSSARAVDPVDPDKSAGRKRKTSPTSQVPKKSPKTDNKVHASEEVGSEEEDKSIIVAVSSNVPDTEKSSFPKFLKKVGSSMLGDWDAAVTHYVVMLEESPKLPKRTLKLLKAMLTGAWIVNSKWMLECVEQNKVLPCEKFEVKGTTAGGALGGPRKARLSVSRKDPGLFEGAVFFFKGPLKNESLASEYKDIVELGGGKILQREPTKRTMKKLGQTLHHAVSGSSVAKCHYFIVSENGPEDGVQDLLAWECAQVSTSWLLNCVEQYKVLDVEAPSSE